MKKALVLLLALLALLLVSCDGDGAGESTAADASTEAATVCAHESVITARENERDATCEESGGYDSVTYCQTCGASLSSTPVTVDATGHTAGDEQIENEVLPTCTVAGSRDRVTVCTVCEKEISRITQTLAATEHKPGESVKENETPATCTSDGAYESVTYCTVCAEELSRESVTVDARHEMENGVCVSCGRQESTAGLQFYLNPDGKSYFLSHVTADCTATDIVIDLYEGLPVTMIADGVFNQNPAYTNRIPITSVVIGADVREIGQWAFLNCTTLRTVTFQTAHDVILSTFSLNGTGVFEGCTGLERVYVDDLYAYCRMNFGYYPPMCYASELYIAGKPATNVVIPDGIESIYSYAFSSVTLESVTVPASVKQIRGNAFSNCSALTSVTLSEGLEEIWGRAFEFCTALTEITIPDSVTTIEDGILGGCTSMERIRMPFISSIEDRYYETNTLKGLFRREFSSFANDIPACLARVTLSKVTAYLPEMFDGAEGLTEVILADSVTRNPKG